MAERIKRAESSFNGARRRQGFRERLRRYVRSPNAKRQRGFSLLELIASLAIVSLVSAALFQSIAAWMRLSARAGAAADSTLTSIAGQQMFDRAVGGLLFAWPEEVNARFIGAADGFSGVSNKPLQGAFPRLSVVQMIAQSSESSERGRIAYISDQANWTLLEFDDSAAFSYLGADGAWRSNWPPAANPEPAPFADAQFFETPQLPEAIRLSYTIGSAEYVWIADIASTRRVPQRLQDLR